MIKVLHVVKTMNLGGAETLVMNLINNLNGTVDFSILFHSKPDDSFYFETLKKNGIKYNKRRTKNKNKCKNKGKNLFE